MPPLGTAQLYPGDNFGILSSLCRTFSPILGTPENLQTHLGGTPADCHPTLGTFNLHLLRGHLETFMPPLGPPTPPWGHLGTLISPLGSCHPLRPPPLSQVFPTRPKHPQLPQIFLQVCPEINPMSLRVPRCPHVFPKYPEVSLMSLSRPQVSPNALKPSGIHRYP